MKFDKEKLQAIVLMGQQGKATPLIARDLGISLKDLRKIRAENKEVDEAFKDAEANYEEVAKAKLQSDALSGKNNALAVKYFEILHNKNKNTDNEIIIREVE